MKRIVTVQDISCIGKCSITVALPIISSMGIETAVLPTAVLSTHTAFSKYAFNDLTEEIKEIQNHWKNEKFSFDAIYTGYLGSREQIEIMQDFFNNFKSKDNFIFIDPVMGDNGKLYSRFDEIYVNKMKEFCKNADVISPNLTEAVYLLGKEYKEEYDEGYLQDILFGLSKLGPKKVIITGIYNSKNELGAIAYDYNTDKIYKYFKPIIGRKYHGTGDIFASTCVGAMTKGFDLQKALEIAVEYTWKCIKDTTEDKNSNWYGTNFESNLEFLIKLTK